MRPKFRVGFRAWCVAVLLCWGAIVHAAERHPLIGASREQVLTRYGEPRSNAVVGNRELMFYLRERLTLRDGVVVDVERLAAEQPKRPAGSPSPAETAPPPTVAPATPPPSQPEAKQTPPATTTEPQRPVAGTEPAPSAATDSTSPEPKLEIKRVLPPGATTTRVSPSPKQDSAPAASAVTPPTKSDAGKGQSSTQGTVASGGPGSAPTTNVPSAPTPAIPSPAVSNTATNQASASGANEPAVAAIVEEKADEPDPKAAAQKKDAAKRVMDLKAARRKLEQAEAETADPTEAAFTTRTYVIALVIIGGCIGYLVWRRQQRHIELAATAVSRTPFTAPVASATGTVFKADLLAKLEWKRFEELVAAYYSKTGVVATRTKSGPAAPVHIKISWKGEPRPFALVQCIARTEGLVEPKPLQDLVAMLAADDIRRGYVVTTGRFSVPARDFAEEKHITLLPGDIFLEKLNALPDAARAELMQEITAGDFATPSCPKCEAKMVRSPEDPSMWRCPTHPDQQIGR